MKLELAGCVIINKNELLTIHRKTKKWYELPGGMVEDGEEAELTAKRELKEELDISVSISRYLGCKNFTEEGNQFIYHWFLATINEGEIIRIPENESRLQDRHDHYRWINLAELNKFSLSPNLRNFMNELDTNSDMLSLISCL